VWRIIVAMARWVASVAVIAAAVLVAAAASPATPPPPSKICAELSGFVDKSFYETVPPSVSTVTGLGGLPAVSCTWGPLSITDMRATIQNYLLNAPKSGTPVDGKCTKAVTFTGTNTVATTNAATNKTTMKTNETWNLLCFDAAPHPELVRITSSFEKAFLADAERVVVSAGFRNVPAP
jgi:hypothetical protein